MSGLRKKTIACLVCALLVCLMTLLFVNLNFLTARAYTTEGQTREVGGVSWKVNGKNNGDEFTIEENGTVTMAAEPVQDEGNGYDRKIDQTYALRPTQANAAFGIRYTATLDIRKGYASGGCAKLGIFPFYLDQNNYVFVKLSSWGGETSCVNITGRINGKDLCKEDGSPWYEGGSVSYSLRTVNSFQLSVCVFADRLYVYLGDDRVPALTYDYLVNDGGVKAASFGEPSSLASVYTGVGGNLPEVVFSALAWETTHIVSNDLGGGWTSDYPFGWIYDETEKSISGESISEAKALHVLEGDGAYVISAEIFMSESAVTSGTEGALYKAGLVPFYKDADNWIAIWVQQFGNDSNARLTAQGRIGGKVWSGMNEMGFWDGDWLPTLNPVLQPVRFTMKCEVVGRTVNIYINDEYVSSISAQGEIPYTEGGASYGAIVQNGTAQFADIAVKDYVPAAAKVLTVTVSDSESGERITDAEVKLGDTALAEQDNGVYTLDVSELERGTLTVTKENYQVWSQEIAEDVWSLPAVNVSVSLRSVNAPYAEQTREVGGVSWKVNGKNNGDEFTIEKNGTVTMKAEPVQDEGGGYDRKIDQTYALCPTQARSAFGIRYTATLDIRQGYASGGCAKLGIFPFYLDQDNYVFVKLSSWGGETSCVNITGRINGKDLCNEEGSLWYEGGSVSYSLRAANQIKLSVCVFADRLYVYLGDDSVPALTYDYLVNDGGVKAASFGEPSSLESVYTGVGGNLPEVVFSALASETTQIVSNDLGGGWTSDYPFGWMYDEAEKSISGESISEAKALHVLEGDGAYVISAEIFMSESAVEPGTEDVYYKAGLVPFYKDADNWIAVWVQQWGSDANARLTAQGKIGGKVWSGMNDMGFWDGDWLPTLNPVLQPVSFTMKCEVVGRTVNIYINDEYISSISAQGEIPYAEGGASYGVIVQNGTAQFSNIAVQDESAIVSETTVTVTVETIDGELVKDAIVKNGSVDFTNNGDGTYSLTVPVRTPVTVGVQKEGYVYLEYDVPSSAMYQPQVNITLQIAREETIEIPEFDDIAPNDLNVGALVGGIVGGVVGAAAIAVIIIVIVKKKRK